MHQHLYYILFTMHTYEYRIGGKEVHMKNFREKSSLWNDLTDEQSEKLVGGVGAGTNPGAGAFGWGAGGQPSDGHGLISAGFTAPGANQPTGDSGVNVTVPGDKS